MANETDKTLNPEAAAASLGASHRRSSRVTIAIPITVYGRGAGNKIFIEEVRTIIVNAHGGLMNINGVVSRNDTMLLRNPKTGQEATGKIVYFKEAENGPHEIGIEFVDAAPRFWGIAFPPEDWDKSTRKRPQGKR